MREIINGEVTFRGLFHIEDYTDQLEDAGIAPSDLSAVLQWLNQHPEVWVDDMMAGAEMTDWEAQ